MSKSTRKSMFAVALVALILPIGTAFAQSTTPGPTTTTTPGPGTVTPDSITGTDPTPIDIPKTVLTFSNKA